MSYTAIVVLVFLSCTGHSGSDGADSHGHVTPGRVSTSKGGTQHGYGISSTGHFRHSTALTPGKVHAYVDNNLTASAADTRMYSSYGVSGVQNNGNTATVATTKVTTVTLGASTIFSPDLGTHHDYGESTVRSLISSTTVSKARANSTVTSNLTSINKDYEQVHRLCPGVEDFYKNHTDLTMNPIKMTDCRNRSYFFDSRFLDDWVYGHCQDSSSLCAYWGGCADSFSFCQVPIKVPENNIAHIRITLIECFHEWIILLMYKLKVNERSQFRLLNYVQCSSSKTPDANVFLLSQTNEIYVSYIGSPSLHMEFEAVKPQLDVRYMSQLAGFVTARYPDSRGTVCDQLTVPKGHVIVVSFDLLYRACRVPQLLHSMRFDDTLEYRDMTHQKLADLKLIAFEAKRIEICVTVTWLRDITCVKLFFSFHPKTKVLHKLSSGLYNCSVDYYQTFRHHLDCNLKVECEDERDEGRHCPYSSPACDGWVATLHKCYKMFSLESDISGPRARDACRALGSELASIKTEQEIEGAIYLLWGQRASVLFGLTCGERSKPFLYRRFFMWSDNTVIYNANHIPLGHAVFWWDDFYAFSFRQSRLQATGVQGVKHFVCERNANAVLFASQPVDVSVDQQPQINFQQTRQALVSCPEGHVTHAFLSCDRKSQCGQTECHFMKETRNLRKVISATQPSGETVSMYSCANSDAEVSHSLLCDFRQDCVDNSDESFCHHPACEEFSCTNGQCASTSKYCNNQLDCLDGSDEIDCLPDQVFLIRQEYHNQNNSFLISFDGNGYFTQRVMNITDPCPGTHYRCTKEWFYCLPVFTRCNGVFDCVFQEDERNCQNVKCPGLYRCRDATVCLHADNLCDGWPQCPQHDDEWLCDMTCPTQCLCQGHAFLCPQPFSAHLFPQLRYLDARGSGMTPTDLMNNTYIVHLSFAQCSIKVLPNVKFPNLQVYDLSGNKLLTVVMNDFIGLQNLQTLNMRENPLISITISPSTTRQTMLRKIDISSTKLQKLHNKMLSFIPRIKFINISFSTIRAIGSEGFKNTQHLKELDIRGISLNQFPSDLFMGLRNLKSVFASDYRLCCQNILPKILPRPRCLAPKHYLSSCDDMLQSEVHRLILWLVVVLANLGNLICFICQFMSSVVPLPYGGPILVFMASLQFADFCMGIYASVIATAHETFHGQYVYFEDRWKESVACKVAGFLFLLSTEVSTLVTFFLTLEHLILLRFPHSTYRFCKGSASVACGVTWAVGILLASVPLLPGLSYWGHYGQTAVCSLMLHELNSFEREFRSRHVILVLNCTIGLVSSVVMVIAYRATPKHHLLIDSGKTPACRSVGLLMRTVVTHVAAWISVTIVSVLDAAGVEGSEELSVAMAVVVLPLKSAVDPVLCLWHAVAFRRQQKQEERLIRVLKSRGIRCF